MTKIQILNEKQVDHFMAYLSPDFEKRFYATSKDLSEKAVKEKDNFVTHTEIIKLKADHAKKLEDIKIINKLSKELDKLDGGYNISLLYSSRKLTKTDEELKEVIEQQEEYINEHLIKLSKINLHVDKEHLRRLNVLNEMKAQLCMTSVNSFDKIKEAIITNIDINSFFTTTI